MGVPLKVGCLAHFFRFMENKAYNSLGLRIKYSKPLHSGNSNSTTLDIVQETHMILESTRFVGTF